MANDDRGHKEMPAPSIVSSCRTVSTKVIQLIAGAIPKHLLGLERKNERDEKRANRKKWQKKIRCKGRMG